MTSSIPFKQPCLQQNNQITSNQRQCFSAIQIHHADQLDFSADDYSRFKFGSLDVARTFGHLLAERFIQKILQPLFDKKQNIAPFMVIPSAYSHIPTASFYLKHYFVNQVNNFLFSHGAPVLKETKIHRNVSYREDYGAMSAAERYALISHDQFYIDRHFVADHTLIFIDDIKITGTHERIVCKMLDDYQINNPCYLLYFAELMNPEIPPTIENQLNFAWVKNLDHLHTLIHNETFIFNSRVVKFILNSSAAEFDAFIKQQSSTFIEQLHANAVGNAYFTFAAYQRNFNQLHMLAMQCAK